MIRVYYTHAAVENISPSLLDAWTGSCVEQLPAAKREQIMRLRPPLSRFNSALAWQLVKFGFRHSGVHDFELSLLRFDNSKKPHWPASGRDFNISHSECLLACALADDGQVGIDVEYIRPLNDAARMFEQILAPQEHPALDAEFFQYWTRKEAVIKAEGSGGVWDMPGVHLRDNEASYKNRNWRLHPLQLVPGYAACVACDRPQEIREQAVALEQLINAEGNA
ncbi:MAG TPA: 4'-phosphopantetheinyl transferase superfamily protein [Gammaproteobacteria bacterium]|nr:4'-phosphopantetheinyl transferase superfamily protein [Gammaproteobacteria bacterium]